MSRMLGQYIRSDIRRMLDRGFGTGMCEILLCDDDLMPIGNPQMYDDNYTLMAAEDYPLELGDCFIGLSSLPDSYKIYKIDAVFPDGYRGVWIGNLFLRDDALEPSPPNGFDPIAFCDLESRIRYVYTEEAIGVWVRSVQPWG